MIWFIAIAILMIGLCTIYLIYQVLPRTIQRNSSAESSDELEINLNTLREALVSLEKEYQEGLINQDQFENAKSDLQRRALDETNHSQGNSTKKLSNIWAISIGLVLPTSALLLYLFIGTPRALLEPELLSASQRPSAAQIDAMVDKLAKHMDENPSDVSGWMMLGRSYIALNRLPEAEIALKKALALEPKNADLMADLADLMAYMKQSAQGEPKLLIQKALQIDPNNLKALALSGSVAFEEKKYAKAIEYWQHALKLTQADDDFTQGLRSSIANAEEKSGLKPTISSASISGIASLAPALAKQTNPEDTVFIYARATNGPKMPVAIMKIKVSQLPYQFTLDDRLAMSPEVSISKFQEFTVTARISKTGNAIPQAGDLFGQLNQVRSGSKPVNLIINDSQR